MAVPRWMVYGKSKNPKIRKYPKCMRTGGILRKRAWRNRCPISNYDWFMLFIFIASISKIQQVVLNRFLVFHGEFRKPSNHYRPTFFYPLSPSEGLICSVHKLRCLSKVDPRTQIPGKKKNLFLAGDRTSFIILPKQQIKVLVRSSWYQKTIDAVVHYLDC